MNNIKINNKEYKSINSLDIHSLTKSIKDKEEVIDFIDKICIERQELIDYIYKIRKLLEL